VTAGVALQDLATVDRAVYEAIAHANTPSLDRPLQLLSRAANRSELWFVAAACLAVCGGRSGRRAAAQGVASIAAVSALVNVGLKSLYGRDRPDPSAGAHAASRHVRLPGSSSFPSGHAASGFAFATAVGVEVPALALPLRVLATAVAYSRVHTGVHYPADTVAGAVVGSEMGRLVAWGWRRCRPG
jgi:membrane-associated phospholipid phosphatase